ncbi:MAG: C4-dicarboxylate ABC transporter substrate-binding protein [Hyphomicrobiales bacterium]|nr:MAG: C4-dicarboxylate ABC transporter substrate-binding protein [Hyphomicrobiales bacterium]
MKLLMKTMVAASAVAFSVGAVDARDLRLASGAPPFHPAANPLYSSFAEFLPEETNGALTPQMIGPEVVSIFEVKKALQSSLAEVGNLLPMFVPAELPNTALTGDLSFLATNPHAMAAAMTEFVVTCPDCQAEFKTLGGVYTGSGSSDVYVLLTTKPVRSLADLKGLRLRSGGAPYARWAESVGAAPAQIPVSETFESLSQGLLDGTMASVSDLISYRLVDVAKYIIDLPLGTYHTTSNFTVANGVWAELSVDERAGFVRAATKSGTLFTQNWGYERPGEARKTATDAGLEIIPASQDMLDATNAFRGTDVDAAIAVAVEQLGVADAAEKIARFQALVDKWTSIVASVDGDVDAIVAKVQSEVWDKVDFSTYGL